MATTIEDNKLRRALVIEGETIKGHSQWISRIGESLGHTIAPAGAAHRGHLCHARLRLIGMLSPGG